MKKRDWSDCKLTIGCPGDEDSIIIPIHGEKETDINKIMKNAYYNAIRLLEDSQNVSIESSVVLKTLACELFMKAIIIQKKGVQQRSHDLYDLYYELPEEQQQEVGAISAFLRKSDLLIFLSTNNFHNRLYDTAMIISPIPSSHCIYSTHLSCQ